MKGRVSIPKDRIIQAFLKKERNRKLYLQVLHDPNPKNTRALDKAFQSFYFQIRFISYVSKNIYFHSINFDKRRKKQNIVQLTLDQSLTEGEDMTFKDFIIAESTDPFLQYLEKVNQIEEHIENIHLYHALKKLTNNQKNILYLSYGQNLSDTEIAKRLNKSQQAVSKSRKRAVEKLRMYLKGGGSYGCL